MFNIPDEIYLPFRQANKGKMSEIVTDFLRQYMQISLTSNQKIQIRQQKLEQKKKEFAEFASELQREEQAIKAHLDQQKLVKEEEQKQDLDILEIVEEEIRMAKSQGKFVDLVFAAEKAGIKDVQEHLYKIHKEARQ